MKRTLCIFRRFILFFCLSFLMLNLIPPHASANSAQTHWTGTTATGAIITNDECPIVVENENLTFDINEFPKQYYNESEDYLSYNGKVTAEYTFYNPADYTVNAVLAFPFGTVPDYGIIRNSKTDETIWTADTERYNVSIDGTPIDKQLRHTFSLNGSQFELNRDVSMLHSSYMDDEFYEPDLPVTQYTFVASNVDTETYRAANAAFIFSADQNKTKILLENQSGAKTQDNGIQVETWVQDEPFVLNVIGNLLTQMPEWKFYEDGSCEKEIDGTMTLVNTNVITFKILALSEYEADSGILEYDWYNAIVESMKYFEWEYGVVPGSEFQFDISNQLMRWYEYEIVLEPGEKIVNTVTAPVYPSINTNYEPPIYEYTYLLSPAQSWKDFGTLNIMVNTPFYMTESGPEGFEQSNSGYICKFSNLPEGELTFTLCSDSKPTAPIFNNYLSPILLIFLGIVLIFAIVIIVVVVLIRKRRT